MTAGAPGRAARFAGGFPGRAGALLPLAVGGAAIALLAAPEHRAPGHRGGGRVVHGFRPGRWDAAFLVARGPARVPALPEASLVTLRLSGPGALTMRDGGARTLALTAVPTPVTISTGPGADVVLEPVATVRLHDVTVVRRGPPPWPRMACVAALALAAAAALVRRPTPRVLLAATLAVVAGSAVALGGTLGAVGLGLWLDRLAPALVLGLFALVFVAPAVLPPAGPASVPAAARPLFEAPILFGAVVLVSAAAQVLLRPQPLLIGDPAAYHKIGGRFAEALAPVRSPDDVAGAVEALRPYAGLWAAGLLYATLRGLHDTLATIHLVQALAMGGAVFFLVRAAERIGGRRAAWVAGALAALYAPFAILCGTVQPEPFILLLWTWALDRLLAARSGPDLRGAACAGLAFALGLALHPQGIWFLLAAVGLVAAPLAAGLRRAETRAAAAFALGVLPAALATAAGEAYARPAVSVLDERYGFWAYTAPVPIGFWLFIDTDGWAGPHRVADTRYARALLAAEERGEVAGTPDRVLFTARFVGNNASASARTVVRNVRRLFARPDNPYQRDWVLPYTLQVPGHRAMVALFALALPLLAARGAALAAVPVLALAATYPLYHVFNKYAVPATPFLILGAALALDRIAAQRRRGLAAALAVAGLAALVSPGELALGGVPPPAAQVLPTAVWALALGAAFVLAGRAWARGRLGIAATALGAALAVAAPLAAEWRDPTARAFSVALDREVRHEVEVGAEGLRALAGAREAWLFLDLHAADGDVSALRLRFDGGFALDGRALEPAMPTFGLATVRGGRDARGLRQWWRTPWRPEMAAGSRIGLTIDGDPDVRLHGDLGAPLRPASYEALSLGEWPHLSVYRLMHEGEYRLPAGRALEGERRAGARGGRSLPGVLSVRAVVSDDDVGGARWQTAPAPAARIVTAMWARVARQERALVEVAGRVHAIDFARAAVGDPVRFVPTGEGEGWLVLKADAERGRPLTIAFTPVLGTSVVPRVFAPELRAGLPPLPLDWSGLPYVPAARILESRTSPPWRPARVF